jgi:N-acetylmuramic acid 6-phosphate (MurNAc-6-P) etherase
MIMADLDVNDAKELLKKAGGFVKKAVNLHSTKLDVLKCHGNK